MLCVGSVRSVCNVARMPDTPSITLVKRMTYRGADEEFSNTYHFAGSTPATDAAWRTLADAIWDSERTIMHEGVVLVQVYGYVAGNESSVAQLDYRTGAGALPPGTLPRPDGTAKMAGDQAATGRAKVGLSVKGKKIYIRKYWHGGLIATSNTDNIAPGMLTAIDAHLSLMLAGGLPGDAEWCAPQGAAGIEPFTSPFVTTRTLKRRGKRPSAG